MTDGDALFDELAGAARLGLADNLTRFLAFRGMAQGEPLEMQALNVPSGRYFSNRFAHAPTVEEAVKLAQTAEAWTGCPAVYVIGNDVDPAVATRAAPGQWHEAKKGEVTSDGDMRSRRLLYLDFDAVRPKATSSTDAQVKQALEVAGRVLDFLCEHVNPEATAIGMSGNGGAVFVALEPLPEAVEVDHAIKGILASVKAIYETALVAVDVSVCDAKRLMPCFGTMKRKGAPDVADRPHRRTAILTPREVRRLGMPALLNLLTVLRAEVPKEKLPDIDKAMGKRAVAPRVASPAASGSTTDLFAQVNRDCDVRRVAGLLGLADGESVKCPGCGLGGGGDSSVAYVGNGIKCSHNRCANLGLNGFRSVIDVVCEAKGCGAGEALRWVAEEFGIAVPERVRPRTAPTGQQVRPRMAQEPEREQPKFQSVPDRLTGEREERISIGKRMLSFGVKFLDDALGGIVPNDIVLLGAKTGVGKTELARTIAMHNAVNCGKRLHYFALEAEDREIERRMKFQLIAAMFYQEGGDFARTTLRYLDWHCGRVDHIVGKYEDRADAALRKNLKNLHTFYRVDSFTSDDFCKKLDEIKDESDGTVLDHLHYVDQDESEVSENRGYKRMVKQVRDAAIRSGKPAIIVAHVKKGDKRMDGLVPDVEAFHGSSDIPKIATKAIMIAPAYDMPNEKPFLWNTYLQIPKCRLDGGLTRYVALCVFNSRMNVYENEYTLGRLVDGGKKFEPINAAELPQWAR